MPRIWVAPGWRWWPVHRPRTADDRSPRRSRCCRIAPPRASTANIGPIAVSESMESPFIHQDFHFGSWIGLSIAQPPSLDPPKRFFLREPSLLLPSAKFPPPGKKRFGG